MKTPVIFRTFRKGGDVIALFPFEPSSCSDNGWTCQSYQHVGQHGGSSPHLMRGGTRPSTRTEIAPLRRELVRIGYKLKTLKRFPRNAYAMRKAELNKTRATAQ